MIGLYGVDDTICTLCIFELHGLYGVDDTICTLC